MESILSNLHPSTCCPRSICFICKIMNVFSRFVTEVLMYKGTPGESRTPNLLIRSSTSSIQLSYGCKRSKIIKTCLILASGETGEIRLFEKLKMRCARQSRNYYSSLPLLLLPVIHWVHNPSHNQDRALRN